MGRKKACVTEYRNCHLEAEFPVMLLSGEQWRISDDSSKNYHFHNCLEIGICHEGTGYMEFNGGDKPLPFQEGDITCIPRNISHTTYSSQGTESHWSYLFVDLGELFRNVLPGMSRELDFSVLINQEYKYILNRDKNLQIYKLVKSIIREMEEEKPYYQSSVFGLLLSLCMELHRVQSEGVQRTIQVDQTPQNVMVISSALDYMEENYAQQIDMNQLADICCLNPVYFRKLFLSIMGMSPLDFLNQTRIVKACNLLRSTDASIIEIAERVGFRSISCFNRHFADVMQMTPSSYRNETLMQKDSQKKLVIRECNGWMYPERI